MKTNLYKIYILFLLIFIGAATHAQNIVQLSFYAPLISTFEMKYIDDHLVVSQDGLLIFDVSDPSVRPKLLSQIPYPGDVANQLAVQDNFAYMSHGNNGLFAVYDISNFNSPVLRGSVAIPATSFSGSGDLEALGNFVYLAGFDSLYVINVSNATAPVVVNRIVTTHTEFTGNGEMVIGGNTLFLKSPFGVDVYNISSPAAPVFTNTITLMHPISSGLEIDTLSHRLFSPWVSALQEFTGYDAYDISNPNVPQFLFADSVELGSGEYGVAGYSYTDTVLYISSSSSINAFDARPASHGFITNFSGEDVANAIVSIAVRDSVFFDAKRGGLEVLEYTDVLPPVCNTPVRLRTGVNGTTALLSWNKISEAKGYIVRHRKVNSPWNYDTSLNNIQVLRNLEPNTLYYWEVASVCSLKLPRLRSDFALTERFNTGSAFTNTTITITPNPVYDAFRISINGISAKEIIITNFTGSTVMRLPYSNGQHISFSKMPAGIYTVQALNNQRQIVAKTTFIKK